MRIRKHERDNKRQRGQYMTPPLLARKIVSGLPAEYGTRILEPSCGDGVFLAAIIDRLSVAPTRRSRDDDIELVGIEI